MMFAIASYTSLNVTFKYTVSLFFAAVEAIRRNPDFKNCFYVWLCFRDFPCAVCCSAVSEALLRYLKVHVFH